jgi:hypothetical protein
MRILAASGEPTIYGYKNIKLVGMSYIILYFIKPPK